MNNLLKSNRGWLFLALFIGLFATLSFAGNQTDALGLGGVYDTIEEWTNDRNLNLLIVTTLVIIGLVRWFQIGGFAGGVQFASLFVLAVIFFNSSNIVASLYTGVF